MGIDGISAQLPYEAQRHDERAASRPGRLAGGADQAGLYRGAERGQPAGHRPQRGDDLISGVTPNPPTAPSPEVSGGMAQAQPAYGAAVPPASGQVPRAAGRVTTRTWRNADGPMGTPA